jgi:hypothetical protein
MQRQTTTEELVFSGVDFRRTTEWLVGGQHGCVVGSLIKSSNLLRPQWIVQELSPSSRIPTGSDYSVLSPWLEIELFNPGVSSTIDDCFRRFQPMPGQHFIHCSIGSGQNRGEWNSVLFHAGRAHAIDLHVAGSPYLKLTQLNNSRERPEVNHGRWTRLTNVLGTHAIDLMGSLQVMILGASRNGSTMARQLAALGFGHLTLVDPDILEIHNFDAMLGGDIQDCGIPKVVALSEELVRFNDQLRVTRLPYTATDSRVIEAAKASDILITTVDHGTAVLVASKIANRWNKIHLDIGTSVQHEADGLRITGDVRMFLPREACAMCVGGIPDLRNAQVEMKLPSGAVPFRVTRDFRAERAGSLVTINSIAVSVGVQMLLDLLTGRSTGSQWTRLELHPTKGLQAITSRIERPGGCRNCG